MPEEPGKPQQEGVDMETFWRERKRILAQWKLAYERWLLFEDDNGDIIEGFQKYVDAAQAQGWKKFLQPCLAVPEIVLEFYAALPEVEGNKVVV